MIQLSPLSAALIGLCDGTRTVAEIAAVFPRLGQGLESTHLGRPACSH